MVALLAVTVWLPWLLVATCCSLAILALRRLSRQLPARAVRPASSALDVNPEKQQIQGSVLRVI